MGHFTIGRGQDENGNWYKSYYDKWDLAPMNYGKPMYIYGRVYEATGTETPPSKNRPKLAVKIDAANNKSFANKTYTARPPIKKGSQGLKLESQLINNNINTNTMKFIPRKDPGGIISRYLKDNAVKFNAATPAAGSVSGINDLINTWKSGQTSQTVVEPK
jgi:hypothetical protein